MQTKIFTCLVLATLLLTQCKKQDIVTTKTEKEQSLIQQAKAFVKEQAPAAALAQLNWTKTQTFKKEGQAVYLRIPVNNQQAAAGQAIYLKYYNATFSGNYFSINKAPGGSWAIATQSLDGVRTCQATVTADGRLQNCQVYEQGNLLYELRNAYGARVGGRRVQVVLVDNAGQALIWASMLGAGQQGWVDPTMSNWTNLEYLSSDPNNINDPGGSNAPYIVVNYDYLEAELNLSPAAFDWLWDNTFEAAQLYAYLKTSTVAGKINIAKAHIDNIMADADYANFVKGHTAIGNQLIVWWQDETWLKEHFSLGVDTDDLNKPLKDITPEELALTLQYPDAAFKINRNAGTAQAETINRFGSNGLNDKSDAFRHTFWLAINTKSVGAFLALAFSNAHETDTPAKFQLEKQMDLHNNSVGVGICPQPALTAAYLAQTAWQAVQDGTCWYISPINYTDPCFWRCAGNTTGTHGITSNTIVKSTNQ